MVLLPNLHIFLQKTLLNINSTNFYTACKIFRFWDIDISILITKQVHHSLFAFLGMEFPRILCTKFLCKVGNTYTYVWSIVDISNNVKFTRR